MIKLYGLFLPRENSPEAWVSMLPSDWRQEWLCHHRIDAAHATQSIAGLCLLRSTGLTAPLFYQSSGRPFLSDGSVDFNITHTAQFVCCAICDEGHVGVDAESVERLRHLSLHALSRRWLSDRESALWEGDPTPEHFSRLWTRKEATVKHTGEGLSALSSLDTVTLEYSCIVSYQTYFQEDICISLCHDFGTQAPKDICMCSVEEIFGQLQKN